MLYLANILLAFHLFLTIYINSSYLAQFLSEDWVGIMFTIGSLLSLASFFFITNILERFGTIRSLTILTALEFLVFVGLAFPGSTPVALTLFVFYLILYPLILYALDILLERYTDNENETGSIRGIFLTTTNIALIASPLLTGLLVGEDNYTRVFLVAALFLIPFLFIMRKSFGSYQDGNYTHMEPYSMLSCILHNKNILTVFKSHFIMQLFFAWMVVYPPLYLVSHLGFDWATTGIIFTVMLIPYLFEVVFGKIADYWLGEKELLTLGFVITAVFVGLMSFTTSMNPAVWAAILFMTRVGGSLMESMTEVYFFRHVDSADANTISAFRMLRPLAYAIAPLLAVIALLYIDIQYLFIIFAVIILYGIRYSLTLKDSR